MYHRQEIAVNNTTGVPIAGVQVRLYDASDNLVSIYADSAGTPIISASGIADTAVSDDAGNYSYYVANGVYTERLYVGDSLAYSIPNLVMQGLVTTIQTPTFAGAATIATSPDTNLVIVSGTSAVGDSGTGRQFAYDATVDAAYVAANPTTSFVDATGRGFKEIPGADAASIAAELALKVATADLASTAAGKGAALVGTADSETAQTALDGRIKHFSTHLALQGVSLARAAATGVAYLSASGEQGLFKWDGSNLSAYVSADTQTGIYLAPTADTTGASGAWVRQNVHEVAGEWFGAEAGGTAAANATAIQAAIDYAVANDYGFVTLGFGQYDYNATLTLATHGIAIVGRDSSKQTGSSDAHATVLNWTGGASPMFTCAATYPVFRHLGIQNSGTATDFLEMNASSQGLWLENCSLLTPSGTTSFSRSIIRSNGNRLGYTVIRHVNAKSCAPVFISIDGQGTSGGITSILIDGESQFDSSVAAMTVVKVMDEQIERLTIRDSTFITNSTGNELCIVDTASNTPEGDVPLDPTINILDFSNNELDKAVSGTATWRYFKLKNVKTFIFDKNHVDLSGTITAVASLTNTRVTSCQGNRFLSITGPVFAPGLAFTSGGTTAIAVGDTIIGATSGHTATVTRVQLNSGSWASGDAAGILELSGNTGRFSDGEALNVGASTDLATVTAALSSAVTCGDNSFDTSNTQGLFNDRTMGLTRLSYSATVDVELRPGNERPEILTLDVTDTSNFTFTLRDQANYFRPTPGKMFAYEVRNRSGSATGATQVRFNSNHTMRSPNTLTSGIGAIANGYSRMIWFYWDGAKAIEIRRDTADTALS